MQYELPVPFPRHFPEISLLKNLGLDFNLFGIFESHRCLHLLKFRRNIQGDHIHQRMIYTLWQPVIFGNYYNIIHNHTQLQVGVGKYLDHSKR